MTLEELVRLYKAALTSHRGKASDYLLETHLSKAFDKLQQRLPGLTPELTRKIFRDARSDAMRESRRETRKLEGYARVQPDTYPVDRTKLDVVLNSLPEDQSTALTCKFIGGLTTAQICAILDLPKDQVEDLLRQALESARDIYES